MPIPECHVTNFATLKKAFGNGDIALLECLRASDQKLVYIICAVEHEDGEKILVPFAEMFTDNPYEQWLFPNGNGSFVAQDGSVVNPIPNP